MSVRTRTRPTSKTEKRTSSIKKTRAKRKSIPWREVFKEEINKYTEAGLTLRASRLRADMTQQELADALGISQHHISEMEHGKKSIGKEMAKRLGIVFKKDYRRFL